MNTDPRTTAIPIMWTDWMAGITQLLWFCIKTLGDVVDSHSANCLTIDIPGLERGRSQKFHSLHGVAGLSGSRRCFPGAFGDSAYAGSKIAAVAERIQLDAENRPHGERGRRNPLRCHGRCARHFDAPVDVLPVLVLGQFAVGSDQIEVDLGVVGLCNELVGYP